MDEGWAVFLPQDFQTVNSKTVDSRSRKVEAYLKNSGTLYDIPMMVLSNQLKSPSYRIAAYQKSSCSYDILKDILGEKVFKECLREYINRWNGKHPMPFDFFNTFKDVSGENLDWFFKPWFFEFGYPDLSLVSASENNGEWSVVIEKKGNYPVPVCLEFETANGNKIEYNESAKVWSTNKSVITLKKDIQEKIVSIKLGNKYIPDVNPNDNLINTNK
jgi:aminopeptidase N